MRGGRVWKTGFKGPPPPELHWTMCTVPAPLRHRLGGLCVRLPYKPFAAADDRNIRWMCMSTTKHQGEAPYWRARAYKVLGANAKGNGGGLAGWSLPEACPHIEEGGPSGSLGQGALLKGPVLLRPPPLHCSMHNSVNPERNPALFLRLSVLLTRPENIQEF